MRRRRRDSPLPPFNFVYRGVTVLFDPHDLDMMVDINLTVYINGEQVTLDREESMRFIYEYVVWLNEN